MLKLFSKTSVFLSPAERRWRSLYNELLAQGYRLRARYNPDWTPSWIKAGLTLEDVHARGLEGEYEDCVPTIQFLEQAIDATRVIDGKQIWLKDFGLHLTESIIMKRMSSDAQRDDPNNHCATLLDILYLRRRKSNIRIAVMPMYREWHDPALHLVGEAMDFIGQLLDGLAFLHRHNIAHGDIKSSNIMMDANMLFPDGFNPLVVGRGKLAHARTLRDETPRGSRIDVPVKYIYIDFGLSRSFKSLTARRKVAWVGGDRHLPEIQGIDVENGEEADYEPFAGDIHSLGHFLLDFFVRNSMTLIMPIAPLILQMMEKDPLKRPTADKCVSIFRDAAMSLSWSLCYRLPPLRLYTWEAPLDEIIRTQRREEGEYINRLTRFLQATEGQPRLLSQIPYRPAFISVLNATQETGSCSLSGFPTRLRGEERTMAVSGTTPTNRSWGAFKSCWVSVRTSYQRCACLRHPFRKDTGAPL